jgi:hypothetical protein
MGASCAAVESHDDRSSQRDLRVALPLERPVHVIPAYWIICNGAPRLIMASKPVFCWPLKSVTAGAEVLWQTCSAPPHLSAVEEATVWVTAPHRGQQPVKQRDNGVVVVTLAHIDMGSADQLSFCLWGEGAEHGQWHVFNQRHRAQLAEQIS